MRYPSHMATTLNISLSQDQAAWIKSRKDEAGFASASDVIRDLIRREREKELAALETEFDRMDKEDGDRKSTRLNSSHMSISYAVFCLKKKKKNTRKRE